MKHIVYSSFIGIEDPANPAEVRHDHAGSERLIRASGLAFTVLRDAHYADAMIVMGGQQSMRSGQWGGGWGEGREAMVWREDCALCAAAEVTGYPIKAVLVDDEAKYAIFDALGVPRRPVDDQYVSGIPWNSDDMVSFGRAIREGFLALRSNAVEALLGRPPRSVRELVEANVEMLRAASPA